MSLSVLLSSERRFPLTMVLAFLPWIAVVLLTAGAWGAANFLGYAIIIFAAGYSIVKVALPASVRTQTILLAPALGILAISALTAFWLRLGFPLTWTFVLWLGLMVAGAMSLWSDRALWMKSSVGYGGALVVLSVLICAVFFLPGARNDAVVRRDGSFNWIYVDTQYFHSVAASIKNSDGPPKTPGTSTDELRYHFGPYAPAAAISRLDGLELGDAFARVTRGASLWALVLSCFGLGTLLSLKANGTKFGAVMSVAGLFFYGSLLSLFTNELNGSSYVTGAILFVIPSVAVPADGGPFSHLILGHSMLHGLGAVTAIMGICLMRREQGTFPSWRELMLVALPACVVSVNSVAALYCLGIVGILLYWGRLGEARSWLSIMLMFGLFLEAWHIMGYSHSPDMTGATINRHPGTYWWWVVMCFTVGLGFRIVGFRWITRPLRDPLSVLVIASALGLLLFNLSIQVASNERYGMYYLDSVFSIFAFSRLKSDWWRGTERARWITEWLRLMGKAVFFFIAYALLMRILDRITHTDAWISYNRAQIVSLILLGVVIVGTSALMKWSPRSSMVVSATLMGVLMIGFLAWVTPWLNFGMGRMKMDVTISPGEVKGLKRLGELAGRGERFATNKHDVDSLANKGGRSYAYAALAERPVLLEGYFDHTRIDSPAFNALLHDNDLIFTTTDAETLRNLAKAWSVRWLVARPGTDIALPKPLPPWLLQQQGSGDLRIYRIE
ncbi:MAG TPA: hypothetical protein VMI10_00945 [Terriglobales bacterium]|nr:hypothetical protein [Terriglobales bacterium]